jgi:hypothetical protein
MVYSVLRLFLLPLKWNKVTMYARSKCDPFSVPPWLDREGTSVCLGCLLIRYAFDRSYRAPRRADSSTDGTEALWRKLVLCHFEIIGYSLRSFTRARVMQFSSARPSRYKAALGWAAKRRQAAALCVEPAQRMNPMTVLRHAAMPWGILPHRRAL